MKKQVGMMAMLTALLAEPLPIRDYNIPPITSTRYTGGGFKIRKGNVDSSALRDREARRKKRRRAQHESRRINYANA